MFEKYKQAPVDKKLPRLVRLDKIQNPNILLAAAKCLATWKIRRPYE
jgi:hypothetical protein